MRHSQNGWPSYDRTVLATRRVPGTYVFLTLRKDEPGELLLEVASAFDRLVEDIDDIRGHIDDWSYAERLIVGGTEDSNHASGTAEDLNASKHPLGTEALRTFSPAQVFEIHRILVACLGVVVWGGDYRGRKDPMHWEIGPGQTIESCRKALASIRVFNWGGDLSAQFEIESRAFYLEQRALNSDLRKDLDAKHKEMDLTLKELDEVLSTLKIMMVTLLDSVHKT